MLLWLLLNLEEYKTRTDSAAVFKSGQSQKKRRFITWEIFCFGGRSFSDVKSQRLDSSISPARIIDFIRQVRCAIHVCVFLLAMAIAITSVFYTRTNKELPSFKLQKTYPQATSLSLLRPEIFPYFVRGSITARLTSCLTSLVIWTNKTGGHLDSDTSPYKVSEKSPPQTTLVHGWE